MSSGEVLLSTQDVEGAVSDPVSVDEASASRRRRGRGSFLYRKNELYCDRVDDGSVADYNFSSEDEDTRFNALEDESGTVRNCQYLNFYVFYPFFF